MIQVCVVWVCVGLRITPLTPTMYARAKQVMANPIPHDLSFEIAKVLCVLGMQAVGVPPVFLDAPLTES